MPNDLAPTFDPVSGGNPSDMAGALASVGNLLYPRGWSGGLGGMGSVAQRMKDAYSQDPMAPQSQALASDLAGGFVGSIDAFHGTPHTFEPVEGNPFGAFGPTETHVGTGEGAQVYGHGYYVAGNPKVAENYARSLGGENGNLYNVQIKPDEHELLDWDKPMADQSPHVWDKIEAAIGSDTKAGDIHDILGNPKTSMYPRNWGGVTGGDVYEALARMHETVPGSEMAGPSQQGQIAASAALHNAGIPGIKYLDQWSRLYADPRRLADDIDTLQHNISVYSDDIASIRSSMEQNKNNLGLLPGSFTNTERMIAERQDMVDRWKQRVNDLQSGKHLTSNYVIFHPSNLKITGRNGEMLEPVEHNPYATTPVDTDPFGASQ